MMTLLLLWATAQDPPAEKLFEWIEAQVQHLISPDIEVRRRAVDALKKLKPSDGELLRTASVGWKDPEVNGALREVRLHLTKKEGEALYQEGKLREALLKMVESEGVVDAERVVRERIRKARERLNELEPESWDGAIDKRIPGSEFSGEFWKQHGRWAIAAVFERQAAESRYFDAPGMLRGVPGEELIPPACGLALNGSDRSATFACFLLERRGRGFPQAKKTLETIIADGKRPADLRKAAAQALEGPR